MKIIKWLWIFCLVCSCCIGKKEAVNFHQMDVSDINFVEEDTSYYESQLTISWGSNIIVKINGDGSAYYFLPNDSMIIYVKIDTIHLLGGKI